MRLSSPGFSPIPSTGGLATILRYVATALLALVATGTSLAPAHAVLMDWVTVGDPGNAADTSPNGYGAVNYEYRIGKYEVTIGQYAEFLNAAAKSDPYSAIPTGDPSGDLHLGLWHPKLQTDLNVAGIARSDAEGSYAYSVIGPAGSKPTGADSPGNRPITYVSWFDAARYANWLHNGQGSGSTETGAYTLNGAIYGTPPVKNPGALFWIPTEHEWYKAAYYKGGGLNAGYWDYAMRTNSSIYNSENPGNTIGSGTNRANYMGPYSDTYAVTQSKSYSASQNYLTNVGAFFDNASAYGTFDQSGNVAEWTNGPGVDASSRRVRGGGWGGNDNDMDANIRTSESGIAEHAGLGFRLASVTPTVVSGSQVYSSPVSGVMTTGSGAAPQFTAGFTGSLTVTGGTATLGGPIAGTVTVGAGAAATIASGATLANAKISLTPGAILNVARGTHVPIAAGSIGGITVSSTSGRTATVLSGSVSTDVTIVSTFSSIGDFSAAGGGSVIGDVLTFQGTGTATWVLQMQYDPLKLPLAESSMAEAGQLFLTWRNPGANTWVNAVDGNIGGTKELFLRGWQEGDALGSYGVDVTNNTVWAVINHNSDFAITAVPEPATWALALAGLAGVGVAVGRKRPRFAARRTLDSSFQDLRPRRG